MLDVIQLNQYDAFNCGPSDLEEECVLILGFLGADYGINDTVRQTALSSAKNTIKSDRRVHVTSKVNDQTAEEKDEEEEEEGGADSF
ncbi:unnamed protein product [Taenia asiatica]|uniref:Pre-rRNA-processing protein TSR2 homolog n=1 Tax=Taenia asiatica TaxID=60517 RepID=A0A0R3WGW7_TAEAS|nr:unnamed protein product [Taenia asiatica]